MQYDNTAAWRSFTAYANYVFLGESEAFICRLCMCVELSVKELQNFCKFDYARVALPEITLK